MIKYRTIGHRGKSGEAPENTMASFRAALDDPAVDVIECDIQLTRDGEVVIVHDYTVERTSDGRGLVKDHTYRELLQYDFGAWFSPGYRGERIPLFSDLLKLVDGRKRIQVEIKDTAGFYPQIGGRLVDIIEDYPKHTLMIESFNHGLVKSIKEKDPGICTGIIVHDNMTLLMEEVRDTKSDFVSIFFGNVTQQIIDRLTGSNIELTLWTLNHDWQFDYIKQFNGTFYIASDYPSVVTRNMG